APERRRDARFAEEIRNDGSGARPEIASAWTRGERGNVALEQVIAFRLQDVQKPGVVVDRYPEEIEQTLAVERIVQHVRVVALAQEPPVGSGRSEKDRHLFVLKS